MWQLFIVTFFDWWEIQFDQVWSILDRSKMKRPFLVFLKMWQLCMQTFFDASIRKVFFQKDGKGQDGKMDRHWSSNSSLDFFFKYETIVSRNGLSLGYSERDTSSLFTFVSPDNNSAILGTTCNYWSVRSNRWRPCHIPNPIGMAFKFTIGLSNPISRFILTPNFDHIVTSAGNQPFFADFRTPTHRVAPNVMSGWDFFNFPIILFGNVFQYGNWTIRRSTSQN